MRVGVELNDGRGLWFTTRGYWHRLNPYATTSRVRHWRRFEASGPRVLNEQMQAWANRQEAA